MPLEIQEQAELGGLEVEAEHTRTTLRVFKVVKILGVLRIRKRIFSCEVTAISLCDARVTNGNGVYNKEVAKTIRKWFISKNYKSVRFEKSDGRVKTIYYKS